jgi:periplasmic protein TonB
VKRRLGFGLSLLVALSLHAVILLVPRVAGRGAPAAQTIEVSLAVEPEGPGAVVPSPPAAPKGWAAPAPPAAAPAASAPTSAPTAAAPEPPSSPAPPGAPPDTPPADKVPESFAAPGEAAASAASEAAPGGSGTAASASFSSQGGGSGVAVPGGGAAQGAGAAGTTTSKPRPRGEIKPGYPPRARRAGWEGVATIRAVIDETGRVVSAEVLASSGHQSLDQAALEAVKSARFDPALRGARPVASPVDIPVRFRLN